MATAPPSDSDLVTRSTSGDMDAYAELVNRYQGRVYNTTYRLLGDYEDARDAAQEVFMKAWKALPTFRGDSRFSTWLYRIAVNTARSAGRKRKKRATTYSMNPGGREEAPIALEADGPDPLQAVTAEEHAGLIQDALNALDDDHRRVLVLHEMEGLTYGEIAEVLACAEGTVKSRMHRARAALRGGVAHLIKERGARPGDVTP